MKFEINEHKYDRAVRIVLGLFLCSMAFWGPESYWFLLGLVPLVTGIVGWCPPYSLLGINTNKCCTSCCDKEKKK